MNVVKMVSESGKFHSQKKLLSLPCNRFPLGLNYPQSCPIFLIVFTIVDITLIIYLMDFIGFIWEPFILSGCFYKLFNKH